MIKFKFPDIGEGIHEGKVLKWLYDVGAKVEEGETMVIVETDKVNAEIPVPEDGTLKEKGADVGEMIEVGEILAVIAEEGDEDEEEEKETETEKDEEESETKADAEQEESASVVGSVETSDEVLETESEEEEEEKAEERTLATPAARKLAKDLGVDIAAIEGSGEKGRIMKADIHAAADKKKEKPDARQEDIPSMPSIPKEGTRREKISSLRKSVVKAMDTSNRLIPATTVMDEFDVTELVTFRKTQKPLAEEENVKLTYLPFIVRAVILALKEYPRFNASYDHETEEIVYKDYVNIGIAVDTPEGLVVPNIKDADKLSVFAIANEIGRLAENAREKKLTLDDLQNTTFSITNYGAFGSKLGTPVIKHPEVAILGTGAIEEKPVVEDGEVVVRSMFPVSLTIDHRVIDGGDAGRFMVQLKRLLQNPVLLLLR